MTADVYVDRRIIDYAVALTTATRHPRRSAYRPSSRTSPTAPAPRLDQPRPRRPRALAVVRGRRYVIPTDVTELAHDVLRHRIVLSFPALAEEVTADMILDKLIPAVPAPQLTAPPSTAPR